MKRPLCLALAVLAMVSVLSACKKQTTETAWKTTLPNTGVTMTVDGGEVMQSTTLLYPDDGTSDAWEEPLLTIPAVATLTWEGIQPEDLQIAFVYAWDGCYRVYDTSSPIDRVDYRLLESESDTLRYRFDTAYCFIITVTTQQGTDEFILDCRRDIG